MTTLLMGAVVLFAAVFGSMQKGTYSQYFQTHSLVIVFGGAIGIMFLSTPTSVLKSVLRLMATLLKPEQSLEACKKPLLELVKNRHAEVVSDDQLIQYGMDLWKQGVEADVFVLLLSQKKRELESRTLDAVQALKNLVKYPPALGMIGTVIGMISLFTQLDSNRDHLGMSLSIAMTATFFGLVLTNAFISPMADRLHVQHLHQQRHYENVYELLILINLGEAESLIHEEMNHRAA